MSKEPSTVSKSPPPANNRRLFLEALPDPKKLITKAVIKIGDTVLEAIAKLQGQISARFYSETSEKISCQNDDNERYLPYTFSVSEAMQGDYVLTMTMIVSGSHSGSNLTFTPMFNHQPVFKEPIVIRCANPELRIPITIKKLVYLPPGQHTFYITLERSNVTFGTATVTAHSGSVEFVGHTV